MKILFCTDGSEISLNAFYNITHFVKEAVIDPICVVDWGFLPNSMNIEEENYSKTYENIADSVLNYAEKIITENNFAMGNKIKSFGSAVEGILEQLANEDYDLILLGSHGKKGIQKWLGSVSRQVVANSQIPVFVSKKRTKGEKVLFTVDGSEHSLNAIRKTLKTFDLQDKEISIISVKENPELLPMEATLDKNWLESIEKQQKIHSIKAINKAKTIIEESNLKIHNEIILTGSPAQKIIDFSEREKTDLIVMGARTKTDLSKILLGSVSKRVLENTGSDVMVISK